MVCGCHTRGTPTHTHHQHDHPRPSVHWTRAPHLLLAETGNHPFLYAYRLHYLSLFVPTNSFQDVIYVTAVPIDQQISSPGHPTYNVTRSGTTWAYPSPPPGPQPPSREREIYTMCRMLYIIDMRYSGRYQFSRLLTW